MNRAITFAVTMVAALLVAAANARAEGAAVFTDGSELAQGGAAFLCLPGQPDAAQDQTSGVVAVGGELYSIGDDSGQVFNFSLDPPYMKRFEAMRVPLWRPNLDLESLAYIPQTNEFAVTLESGDTRVRIMREVNGRLELDREFDLELPPRYQRGTNLGPEGLTFVPDAQMLIVGWEGYPLWRAVGRYLSFYRLELGERSVTSVRFLSHVRLPECITSVCGLHYDEQLGALLVLDRNSDALYAFPGFDATEVALAVVPHYELPKSLKVELRGIRDGFGREYRYRSFEGVTMDEAGRLYLTTDPWRSYDRSTYRPVDDSQMDDYYGKFVPQIVWFDGFRERLAEVIGRRSLGL